MNSPNFIGLYFYSIDVKNRLAIPAKIRLFLSPKKELILSCGLEGCLSLYPSDAWTKLREKLELAPLKDKSEQRAFKRMLFASACAVEFDEEGRILIPQPLVDYAQLKNNVAIIGMGQKIEIWAKHLWLNYEKKEQIVFLVGYTYFLF